MIRPTLITPPAATPVVLEEVKDVASVDFDDDDSLLESYFKAAVAHLDGYAGILGRCMVTQTWEQPYRDWCYRMRLPFPDVSSVVVTYFDVEGQEQAVSDTLYEVIEGPRGGEVVFKDAFTRPSLDSDRDAPVVITFDAGYGAAADVPEDIKVAIKALTRHWYDGEAGMPAAMVLVNKYRFVPI